MRTVAQLFFEGLERGDSGRGLGFPTGPPPRGEVAWTSRRRVAERVAALAAGMDAMGLERGDRIAILAENRNEWALVDFAALCTGLVVVPIYPTLAPETVAFLLADSGTRVLFLSDEEQSQRVGPLRTGLDELEHLVRFQGEPARGEVSLASVEASGSEDGVRWLRARAQEVRPEDLATLVYTSGTTGRPKGVMLSHGNLSANVEAAVEALPLRESDLALSFLPLSHIFERTVDYSLWWSGAAVLHCPRIEWVAGMLRSVEPTFFAGVPRLYEKVHARILERIAEKGRVGKLLFDWACSVGEAVGAAARRGRKPPLSLRPAAWLSDVLVRRKVRAAFGRRLRLCMSGGAALRPDLCRFFWGMGVPIHSGYGMTEAAPILTTHRPGDVRCTSVGPSLPGQELRIAQDGEILARGDNVMQGYLNLPDATQRALVDGWLHTGDLGRLAPDGHLEIIGRKKEILVTSTGKNVVPVPVEEAIRAHELVEEAMLVGEGRRYVAILLMPAREGLKRWAREHDLEDMEWWELLRHPEVEQLYERLVEEATRPFSGWERPKRFALLTRPFLFSEGELTATGKVRRAVVEDHFAEEIEALYR